MNPVTVSDHVIRLRGPWTFLMETGQSTETVRQPFTKPLPERWREESGPIAAKRKFNSPSGLGPNDVVRLAVQRRGPLSHVLLNDEPLKLLDEESARWEWDITSLLRPFNELRILFGGTAIDPISFSPPLAQVELRIVAAI